MEADARHSADFLTEDYASAGRPLETNGAPPLPARAGQPYERLFREGHRFGFFQAVRLLEGGTAKAPAPGARVAYHEERIRFQADTARVFPATDVKRIEQRGAQVRVTAAFMGLYGVDSPLPYYFYDELAVDEEETSALRDFLDVFNHRLYAFFYRAWKKHRPALHYQPGGGDEHSRRFLTLSGVGTPGALPAPGEASIEEAPVPSMRLAAFAGRLMSQRRNAEGLRALLVGVLGEEAIEIEENVPRWVPIRDRPTMGGGMTLGQSTTIGNEVYDRTTQFRVCVGPIGLKAYRAFLPGGDKAEALCWLVRCYAPDHLDFEVELRLSAGDVPAATLGSPGSQLGLTTFLGTPTRADLTRTLRY